MKRVRIVTMCIKRGITLKSLNIKSSIWLQLKKLTALLFTFACYLSEHECGKLGMVWGVIQIFLFENCPK